jgi:nitrate reductase gamma subunit
LVVVIFSVVSIALGTLVGASMYRWLTERFGWWQLQLGRVGSYFRRDSQRRSGPAPKDH